MKRLKLISLLLGGLISLGNIANAKILINEISSGGKEDWVELFYAGGDVGAAPRDISSLFVTMYRGTNFPLASSPITLKPQDDPTTPFDDRFAVVHFIKEPLEDETDQGGDLNGNGVRDIYCPNYGLWNSDCVVSLDRDDDPKNGDILDFVAFSNRDGSMNKSISKYIKYAIEHGEWQRTDSENSQNWCCNIGKDGLKEWSSLSRKSGKDTNTLEDFAVTGFATPGRENIFISGKSKKIFTLEEQGRVRKINKNSPKLSLNLKVMEKCNMKLRLFTASGLNAGSNLSEESYFPGYRRISMESKNFRGKLKTGLYILHIEAVADGGDSQRKLFPLSLVVTK